MAVVFGRKGQIKSKACSKPSHTSEENHTGRPPRVPPHYEKARFAPAKVHIEIIVNILTQTRSSHSGLVTGYIRRHVFKIASSA